MREYTRPLAFIGDDLYDLVSDRAIAEQRPNLGNLRDGYSWGNA